MALHCAVAYVKYERASCAAAAMEALHETVLADGRTRLKVLLAEAPTARRDAWVTNMQCWTAELRSRPSVVGFDRSRTEEAFTACISCRSPMLWC